MVYTSKKSINSKQIIANEMSLSRWFDEKWINVCELPRIVSCGRDKSTNKNYPYCRPLKRVNKFTPTTAVELSKYQIKSRCSRKRRFPMERIDSKSPKYRSRKRKSPKSKSPSHKLKSPSHKLKSPSPKHKSPSPKRKSPSPKRKSPKRKSPSPKRKSPKRKSPSPKRKSPKRKSPSPKRKSPKRKSPKRKSPKRKSPSPKRKSPKRKSKSLKLKSNSSKNSAFSNIKELIQKNEWFIVSLDGCTYCDKSKELIKSKGSKFESESLNDSNKNYIYQSIDSLTNNYRYFPIIFHNGKFIGGYGELQKLI